MWGNKREQPAGGHCESCWPTCFQRKDTDLREDEAIFYLLMVALNCKACFLVIKQDLLINFGIISAFSGGTVHFICFLSEIMANATFPSWNISRGICCQLHWGCKLEWAGKANEAFETHTARSQPATQLDNGIRCVEIRFPSCLFS